MMQSAGFFVVACETVRWGKTFLDYYQQSFALGDYCPRRVPAQRQRQRQQQQTEEQEIGIKGIMIVLHCRKPRFLSLPVSPQIYRSKSAKFQLRITARIIIIFRRTAPGHICSLFLSFSKCGRRNNAKSAFQYTVNNNTT